MSDEQWLNLTNAFLGLGVLLCALVLLVGVVREFLPRSGRR
jgi:hypothetical protein